MLKIGYDSDKLTEMYKNISIGSHFDGMVPSLIQKLSQFVTSLIERLWSLNQNYNGKKIRPFHEACPFMKVLIEAQAVCEYLNGVLGFKHTSTLLTHIALYDMLRGDESDDPDFIARM